jgi:hypothetical protein
MEQRTEIFSSSNSSRQGLHPDKSYECPAQETRSLQQFWKNSGMAQKRERPFRIRPKKLISTLIDNQRER